MTLRGLRRVDPSSAAEEVRQGVRLVVHRGHNVHPPVRLPALLREQRRRDLPGGSAGRLSLSQPGVGHSVQGGQVSSRE